MNPPAPDRQAVLAAGDLFRSPNHDLLEVRTSGHQLVSLLLGSPKSHIDEAVKARREPRATPSADPADRLAAVRTAALAVGRLRIDSLEFVRGVGNVHRSGVRSSGATASQGIPALVELGANAFEPPVLLG